MAKNRNNLKFSSLKRNQLHSKANTHNSICRKICHEDKKVGNKEYEKSRCKKSTYLIFTNVHTVRVLQYRYNVHTVRVLQYRYNVHTVRVLQYRYNVLSEVLVWDWFALVQCTIYVCLQYIICSKYRLGPYTLYSTCMNIRMLLHVWLLVEPLAAVWAWVGAGVAVDEQVGGQGAAPLEGLPALRTLKRVQVRFSQWITMNKGVTYKRKRGNRSL